MSCFFSAEFPEGFRSLPAIPEKDVGRFQDLTGKIEDYKELYLDLPPKSRSMPGVRFVIGVVVIIAIAVGIMAHLGTLTSFPQNFVHFFQNMNWGYFGAAAAGFTALSIGAGIVIRKTLQREDLLTNTKIGALTGDDHWVPAVYQGDGHPMPGYIDTSTLVDGSGVAFMYAYKDTQDHYSVCLTLIGLTPLHLLGVLAYNIFRLMVIPFYILYRIRTDQPTGNPDEAFRYSDITDELGKTAWRIVRAPFFALADIFSALYALIDPLNGRKLGSYIERYWNDDVTRAEGFWSVRGPQSLWNPEGGRVRGRLGRNGFYAAGCWQPMAYIRYHENKIVKAMSLSKAIQSKAGKRYQMFTQQIIEEKHNELVIQLGEELKKEL